MLSSDDSLAVSSGGLRRLPIVARLLLAFVLVSLLPIGTLAGLALWETQAGAHPEAEERHAPGAVEEAAAGEQEAGAEELAGFPVAAIELGVAALSLVISVGVALMISRTLVRPIRDIEHAIAKVEEGDLRARTPVSGTDELGQMGMAFNKMVQGLEREAVIRDLFGQYVTPELANAAIENQGRLDGQLVTSTVLFADIRDFTGISESLPASELITMLNRYFDRMVRVIVDHGGLVNKFGGDSVLAVFGSPLNPAEDHAARAVEAALALEQALADFNREQREVFLPEIMIGVGVASGDIVAGNVGGSSKLEYTVIGDAVNVAARLQALTKELGETILLSAETARLARHVVHFELVGEVEVRGKARSVRVARVARTGQPVHGGA